jgi:hypothetical protein
VKIYESTFKINAWQSSTPTQPRQPQMTNHNDDIDDIAPPPPPPPPSPYSPRDYPRSFLAHTTIDNCSRVASRRVNCLPQRRQGLLSHASSSPISCRLTGFSLNSYAPINSGAERGILLELHGSGSGSSRDPSTLVILISFIIAIVETLLPG